MINNPFSLFFIAHLFENVISIFCSCQFNGCQFSSSSTCCSYKCTAYPLYQPVTQALPLPDWFDFMLIVEELVSGGRVATAFKDALRALMTY